jgi:D-arabinose 1-dehydrogenase-like Zn-dependent alcohol dehydrogenase
VARVGLRRLRLLHRRLETLCEHQVNTGYGVNGSYAEYAVAKAGYVARVPNAVDPLDAAVLTCAGVTTYKAVKLSGARRGHLVAVFGVGGRGHLALQYAKISGATVVTVDVVDAKLQLGKELGADYVVNALTEDPITAIKALGGAHSAISVAVVPKAFEQAFGALRRGGTLVFVALPADNFVKLPIFETVLNGITIIGSIVGTRKDLAEVYAIHAQGRTRVVRETHKLANMTNASSRSRKDTSRPVSSSTYDNPPVRRTRSAAYRLRTFGPTLDEHSPGSYLREVENVHELRDKSCLRRHVLASTRRGRRPALRAMEWPHL